jgi:hypothetical protein
VSEQVPSRTTFLRRRIFVFGFTAFSLILILKLALGFTPTKSPDSSDAPIPFPVAKPVFDCAANTPLPPAFVESWSAEFQPTSFNVTVVDLVEGCTFSLGDSAATFPTASTGKVIVATRVLEMVASGTLSYADVATDLDLMITESNNESANRLFMAIGENLGISSVIQRYGLNSTTIGRTWGTIQTNSTDQSLLLNQVVGTVESPLPEAQRIILRDLMTDVEPEQAWGAGSGGGIPALWTSAVKNGWYLSVDGDQLPVGLWRINTVGYVWDEAKAPRWIFTGYSDTWATEEQGELAWNAITKQLSATLGIR